LFDFLVTKSKEGQIGGQKDFQEKEYREALGVLEDENVITLNGHISAPTIRFV